MAGADLLEVRLWITGRSAPVVFPIPFTAAQRLVRQALGDPAQAKRLWGTPPSLEDLDDRMVIRHGLVVVFGERIKASGDRLLNVYGTTDAWAVRCNAVEAIQVVDPQAVRTPERPQLGFQIEQAHTST